MNLRGPLNQDISEIHLYSYPGPHYCPLAMGALIDCSAMGEFIDHEFVRAHELQTYCLPHSIGLYNADRSPNEIGKITEAIDLVV